jgi:hypothetical protein
VQIAEGVTESALAEVFSQAGLVDRATILPQDLTIDYPCRDGFVIYRFPHSAQRAVGTFLPSPDVVVGASPPRHRFATRIVPSAVEQRSAHAPTPATQAG